MKCKIESDGKKHIVTLTAENVFEQSAIDAISCFAIHTKIYKTETNTNEKKDGSSVYSTLCLEMENN